MKYEPVANFQSSLVKSFQYDDDSWVLDILMHSGKRYCYLNVPPETFNDFLKAESKGHFYNANVKARFSSVEMEDVPVSPTAEKPNEFLDAVYADMDEGEKPEVKRGEPQLAELLPPDQVEALQPPSKKLTAVETLAHQCQELARQPVTAISTADAYTGVSNQVNALKEGKKQFLGLVEPFVKVAYDAYLKVRDMRDNVVKPVDEAVKARNNALNAYDAEQERLAAAERARLQKIADEEAAKEQAWRTEELRMQTAQELAAAGKPEEAERTLFDDTIQAPAAPVYVPQVQADIPQVAGTSKRENWSAEVTNFDELVLDVAEGIKFLREKGNLGGHAPVSFLAANQTAMNQNAKAMKKSMMYPGVQAVNNPVRATRGAK